LYFIYQLQLPVKLPPTRPKTTVIPNRFSGEEPDVVSARMKKQVPQT